MAVNDSGERRGQVGQRVDGIEFAGSNQRGDCSPVLRSRVVPGKESILAVERYRPDGSLDAVVVDLNATVC